MCCRTGFCTLVHFISVITSAVHVSQGPRVTSRRFWVCSHWYGPDSPG
jgi:hypothetical protein